MERPDIPDAEQRPPFFDKQKMHPPCGECIRREIFAELQRYIVSKGVHCSLYDSLPYCPLAGITDKKCVSPHRFDGGIIIGNF